MNENNTLQVYLGLVPSPSRPRKNFEINKFLLKSDKKNICTQAPWIYCVTENVKKIFLRCLDVK